LRPAGFPDLSDSPQPTAEIGTGRQSTAILAIPGAFGSPLRSVGVTARVDNQASAGFMATVPDGRLDSRLAWIVGGRDGGAIGPFCCDTAWQRMNGETKVSGLRIPPRVYEEPGTYDVPAEGGAGVHVCHANTGTVTLRLPRAAANVGKMLWFVRTSLPPGGSGDPGCVLAPVAGELILLDGGYWPSVTLPLPGNRFGLYALWFGWVRL
jgi:hypothetical protein